MYVNLFQDKQAVDLRQQYQLRERINPLVKALDASLQEFKVRRQAYHSNTFVGNHVDKCLKVSTKRHLYPISPIGNTYGTEMFY